MKKLRLKELRITLHRVISLRAEVDAQTHITPKAKLSNASLK